MNKKCKADMKYFTRIVLTSSNQVTKAHFKVKKKCISLMKLIAHVIFSFQIYVRMEVSVQSQSLEYTVKRKKIMDTLAVSSTQI